METILKISNLNKIFNKHLHAVKNVSFEIKKGNVYGILGPNGSGKSTTLGIVLNVVNKTSGDFEWFGGKVATHDALKKVGAIIERPNFYPYMTAEENLQLVCNIKGIHYDKVEEKLAVVGLLERKDSKFRTFSLGMKQRLAIASALLNDPEILILDEPQKMGAEKTLQSLANFNPLFILRYSATHKRDYNLVYRLDALDAYNQKLVKKITVKGIEVQGLTGTHGYLYLQDIIVSKSAPVARLELEIQTKTGFKREVRKVSKGDDLFVGVKNNDGELTGSISGLKRDKFI